MTKGEWAAALLAAAAGLLGCYVLVIMVLCLDGAGPLIGGG
jgi:hypothetical protein